MNDSAPRLPASPPRLVILIALLLGGCAKRDDGDDRSSADAAERAPARSGFVHPPAPGFELRDVTAESGLSVRMVSGDRPAREILEVNGGGLALFDYDDDGHLDLFIANGATVPAPEDGPGSRLFRNLGGLRFEDVTGPSGLVHTRWSFGAATADVDADGREDVFVCCYGPNALFRQHAPGRFIESAAESGVNDPRWATSAAFGDLDLDGLLDLYVVNYLVFDHERPPPRARYKEQTVMGGPHGLTAEHDVLYRNEGDGRFRDVTADAGCLPPRPAYGLGAVILDFDGDGRPDIFVGNDSMANFLFRNEGEWRFRDIGVASGIASNFDGNDQATMGIAIGDVTGNGRPDVFTTNFSSDTNTLHVNLPEGFFEDQTRRWGLGQISHPFLGWSAAFVDLDLDGAEDLVSFNGHVYPEAKRETMDSEYEQPPLVFRREARRFVRVESGDPESWLRRPGRDRVAVFADLDGNGAIDIVVGELNAPVRLLAGPTPHGDRRWLVVSLDDGRNPGNRRALGATITLSSGEERQTRWIFGGGFQSSGPPAAHFGIPASWSGAALRIRWPDGAITGRDLSGDDFNRRLHVTR